MRSSEWKSKSHFLLARRAALVEQRMDKWSKTTYGAQVRRTMALMFVTAARHKSCVGKIAITYLD